MADALPQVTGDLGSGPDLWLSGSGQEAGPESCFLRNGLRGLYPSRLPSGTCSLISELIYDTGLFGLPLKFAAADRRVVAAWILYGAAC